MQQIQVEQGNGSLVVLCGMLQQQTADQCFDKYTCGASTVVCGLARMSNSSIDGEMHAVMEGQRFAGDL